MNSSVTTIMFCRDLRRLECVEGLYSHYASVCVTSNLRKDRGLIIRGFQVHVFFMRQLANQICGSLFSFPEFGNYFYGFIRSSHFGALPFFPISLRSATKA